MKKYRLVILFVPNITEEQVNKELEKIQRQVRLTRIDKKGLQKLGFPEIHKNKIKYWSANIVTANTNSTKIEWTDNMIKLRFIRTEAKWKL